MVNEKSDLQVNRKVVLGKISLKSFTFWGTEIVQRGIVLGTNSLHLWLSLYHKTLIYSHL